MNNSSDYIYLSELHCSKDALTDNYGWFMQFLLAILAFACLIGKKTEITSLGKFKVVDPLKYDVPTAQLIIVGGIPICVTYCGCPCF